MLKKALFSALGVVLIAQNEIAKAAIDYGINNVNGNVKGTDNTADVAIQNLIATASKFLALLAVLYLLWGGFNILTAGGEEDKVKKGKTIIIHACIGLGVIFLSWSIINWLI